MMLGAGCLGPVPIGEAWWTRQASPRAGRYDGRKSTGQLTTITSTSLAPKSN
jgi:hypothetical protein